MSEGVVGREVACPFCRSGRVQRIALFGTQLLLSQYRCDACGSYFEAVRDDDPVKEAPGGRRAE